MIEHILFGYLIVNFLINFLIWVYMDFQDFNEDSEYDAFRLFSFVLFIMLFGLPILCGIGLARAYIALKDNRNRDIEENSS